MTKFQIFISSIITFIVISTSILQYHHHDQYGNLCMYSIDKEDYCGEAENIDSSLSELFHSHCQHHSHSAKDADHEDESKCSLKLSQVSSTKQFSLKEHSHTFIILHEIFLSYLTEPLTEEVLITTDYKCPPLPSSHNTPTGLRAPPVL